MTAFLFTTLPTNDLGLLTRSLPIAHQLASRGHRVTFCSPANAPRRLIADAGFHNLLPRHALYDLLAATPSIKGLLALIASGTWRRRHRSLYGFLRELVPALPFRVAPQTTDVWNMNHVGALMGMLNEGFVQASVAGLMELMLDSAADVIVDFWNPFAVIAARALGKPLVSVIQCDAHPNSRGFIWWSTPPTDLPDPTPILNRVLARYRLAPISKVEELCVGDQTLVVGTPETDPLPSDSDVTYIGPVLWQQPGAELPAWIRERPGSRPLIWVYSGNPRYASGGSILDSEVVLSATIDALADQDMDVAITTGHHALPKSLQPLPSNMRHEPYLPGLAMAGRCDVMIHHGGYGSCQTGLFAGKPAVILPTFSERESNARRVVATGAGLMVPVEVRAGRKHADANVLRSAVLEVLATPRYAEAARLVGHRLRQYGGARAATELIEQFSQCATSGGLTP